MNNLKLNKEFDGEFVQYLSEVHEFMFLNHGSSFDA